MVLPSSFAMGAKNRSAPGPVASHCHPRLTMVKPLAEQPRVAGVVSEIPVSTVDKCKDTAAPAIGNFEQHRTVALRQILRTDGGEVGGKLDFAVLRIDRVLQVHDARVMKIVDRQREVNAAGYALIRTRVAKDLSSQHIAARSDIDPDHTRVNRENAQP